MEPYTSAFFTLEVEDKIEETMDLLTMKVDATIEELIPSLLSADFMETPPPRLERRPNPDAEEEKRYAAVLLEWKGQCLKYSKKTHCQSFQIDPRNISEEALRVKERTIFKRCSKYIASDFRSELEGYREGFIRIAPEPTHTYNDEDLTDIFRKYTFKACEIPDMDIPCYLDMVARYTQRCRLAQTIV